MTYPPEAINRLADIALSTRDAAGMLDITVDTLRQYIREGDLAAFRLPGNRSRWRVWLSDIRAFAEAGRVWKVA